MEETRFVPIHNGFSPWLDSLLQIVDEGLFPLEQQLNQHRKAAPDGGYLYALFAESA